MKKAGPKFSSSSIHENKFTQQFYSGSYGLISSPHSSSKTFSDIPTNILTTSSFYGEALGRSAFGTASKFISMDMIDFLITNNAEATELDKTTLPIEQAGIGYKGAETLKKLAEERGEEFNIDDYRMWNQKYLDEGGVK